MINKKSVEQMAKGNRMFYYTMSFFDVPNAKGETEVIAIEVIAGSRDEAEKVAREAMGKDKKTFCRVTQIIECSVRSILDLRNELNEAVKLLK